MLRKWLIGLPETTRRWNMWNKIAGYGVVALLVVATRLIVDGELSWHHGALVFAALLAFLDYQLRHSKSGPIA